MEPLIKFFNNKKILITGGGGYLGSKLAERIVNSSSLIFLCDVKFNKLAKSLCEDHKNIELIKVDLTKKEQVNEVCAKINPDFIFHFASLLNRERDFSIYSSLYEVNVKGTLNLLEALLSIPYAGFYFSSSSEVYGGKNQSPFNEEQLPSPVSPYSLTKLMSENLIQTYSVMHQKPYTILRIFNFFGPGMGENFFINQLISTLRRDEVFQMTEGEQKRDFLYIDDLINIIIAICKSKRSIGESINICSGKGIMLKELAMEIAVMNNREYLLRIGALPYRENEVWEMIGSTNKLKSYISKVNLKNSIKSLIKSTKQL